MFWFIGHDACEILIPLPGTEPTCPALEGEVSTTGPPGKSLMWLLIPSLCVSLLWSIIRDLVSILGKEDEERPQWKKFQQDRGWQMASGWRKYNRSSKCNTSQFLYLICRFCSFPMFLLNLSVLAAQGMSLGKESCCPETPTSALPFHPPTRMGPIFIRLHSWPSPLTSTWLKTAHQW